MKILFDILFPKKCAGCRKKGSYLCASCEKTIPALPAQPLDKENIYSLYPYRNDLIKTLLWRLKFKHIKESASVFARPLHTFITKTLEEETLIYLIPIPSAKTHYKKRGFNQAKELAKEIGKLNKNYRVQDILIRKDSISAQTSFSSRKDREANMKDGFLVKDGEFLKDAIVVVLDDIVTTGSTMRAAKKALETFSPKKIICVSVACQEFL
jgi:competence protein ComFC